MVDKPPVLFQNHSNEIYTRCYRKPHLNPHYAKIQILLNESDRTINRSVVSIRRLEASLGRWHQPEMTTEMHGRLWLDWGSRGQELRTDWSKSNQDVDQPSSGSQGRSLSGNGNPSQFLLSIEIRRQLVFSANSFMKLGLHLGLYLNWRPTILAVSPILQCMIIPKSSQSRSCSRQFRHSRVDP